MDSVAPFRCLAEGSGHQFEAPKAGRPPNLERAIAQNAVHQQAGVVVALCVVIVHQGQQLARKLKGFVDTASARHESPHFLFVVRAKWMSPRFPAVPCL
jgi:hypothetical protein